MSYAPDTPKWNLIEDYALLSDSRASALVSREASIEWLCLPWPHSGALLWSLLDADKGGYWSVRIEGQQYTRRRYRDDTMVLETTLLGQRAEVKVIDALVMCGQDERRRQLRPDYEFVRRIECVRGPAEVHVELVPRPQFGRREFRMERRGSGRVAVHAGMASSLIRGDLKLKCEHGALGGLSASASLTEGETRWMALGHTESGPGVWPMIGPVADDRLGATERWWSRWSDSLRLPTVHPDQVRRSALALRAMVYSPSGSILAAPTTSLPEELGGSRNWDYRYCWIRDAAYTMRALLNLGLTHEAKAFLSWLLTAIRMSRPRLEVMYDVFGRAVPKEKTLDELSGYEESRPVRVGNGAKNQLQLDSYGALLDAAWLFHDAGGELSPSAGRMLRGLVRYASRHWNEPDNGIWESRGKRQHHVVSMAMCWIAMDRGLRLARDGVMKLDESRIQREMGCLRDRIERDGYNPVIDSYTATLGGDALDASLLLLGIFGYQDCESGRMQATIDRVYERLGPGAWLYRYRQLDDGLSGAETGRFGICGFWGAEALAAAGRHEEGRRRFDELIESASDLGLFAEEMDIERGRALGNFPQALTHVGLINAACALCSQHRSAGVEGSGKGIRA